MRCNHKIFNLCRMGAYSRSKKRSSTRRKSSRRNKKVKQRGGQKNSSSGAQRNSPALITIHLLCFNEEKIIESTINAYRNLFPNCKIIVYDNESSDSSVEKAKALNCEVRSFSTGGKFDELKLTEMRNNVWKDATTPWIIMCDMDEIIGANQNDLIEEDKKGTTILKTSGYDMLGNSEKEDLSDIRINSITTGEKSVGYSKTICFRQDKIQDINFAVGAHTSAPVAKEGCEVKFSEKVYNLYHYKKLGKLYFLYTQKRATPRAVEMKEQGMLIHYTENEKTNEEYMRRNNRTLEEIPALSTLFIK